MAANYKALIDAVEQTKESQIVFTKRKAKELGCDLPKSMLTSNYLRKGSNEFIRYAEEHGYRLEIGSNIIKVKEPALILFKEKE